MDEDKCKCGANEAVAPHPCPYNCDVNNADEDDESQWCTCCEECTYQCAMDI